MAKGVFERKKPHVNVGTIGHIDHGKTTLTAAIGARRLQERFPSVAKSYKEIAKGGIDRDATKTVTIAAAHVEYETRQPALRPHRLPRPRRLHQEHDHRRRPDGRRHPRRRRQRRPHAADPRAHPARPSGRRAQDRRVPQQDRHWSTIPSCSNWSRWKSASCSRKYDFPGDDIPIIRGSSLPALQNPARRQRPASRSTSWSRRWTSTSRCRSAKMTSRS